MTEFTQIQSPIFLYLFYRQTGKQNAFFCTFSDKIKVHGHTWTVFIHQLGAESVMLLQTLRSFRVFWDMRHVFHDGWEKCCIYAARWQCQCSVCCDGQAERPWKSSARSYQSFCFCHCGDTDMKTRLPSIPAEQDEISNALKGHPHIFVAREDLSTSEVLCCGLTFRNLSQTSIRMQHIVCVFQSCSFRQTPAGLPIVLSSSGWPEALFVTAPWETLAVVPKWHVYF